VKANTRVEHLRSRLSTTTSKGRSGGDEIRALIVFAHPIRQSLMGTALDRCVQSLVRLGAQTRIIDLYAEDFAPSMSIEAWHRYPSGTVDPELASYVTDLQWANMLVLIYPTWFGGQPAILKGWFDRVFLPGVAFTLPKTRGHLRPGLRNISSLIVVTSHGSGKIMNSVQGEPGKRLALRGLRSLCSRGCKTAWLAFYGNDRSTDPRREEFLGMVEQHFTNARTVTGRR
jgi:NAD(P)H dehydrogenase (quinone)